MKEGKAGELRQGVVLIIKNTQNEILLLLPKREENNNLYLPGGGIEKGETDYQALKRELREELKLHESYFTKVEPTNISMNYTYTSTSGKLKHAIKKVYYAELLAPYVNQVVTNKTEINEIRWLKLADNYKDTNIHPEHLKCIKYVNYIYNFDTSVYNLLKNEAISFYKTSVKEELRNLFNSSIPFDKNYLLTLDHVTKDTLPNITTQLTLAILDIIKKVESSLHTVDDVFAARITGSACSNLAGLSKYKSDVIHSNRNELTIKKGDISVKKPDIDIEIITKGKLDIKDKLCELIGTSKELRINLACIDVNDLDSLKFSNASSALDYILRFGIVTNRIVIKNENFYRSLFEETREGIISIDSSNKNSIVYDVSIYNLISMLRSVIKRGLTESLKIHIPESSIERYLEFRKKSPMYYTKYDL